jgi:hypothetical protein
MNQCTLYHSDDRQHFTSEHIFISWFLQRLFDGTVATGVYFNQIIMYDVQRTWEKHL